MFSLPWPRLSYREQFKEGDEEEDRGNDGKTTSKSGLAKTVLQGTVQGGRRRGGQRKRWEDNIKECAGLNGTSYYGKLRTARSGGIWL